jgi:hypothetical protein
MAEQVTLGTILSIKWSDCERSIEESGEDAEDYASLIWAANNPRPKPTMLEIVALREAVTAELAAQAIAYRRRERMEEDGGPDNVFRAISVVVAQMDRFFGALKPTSFTDGNRPNNVTGWATLKVRLDAIKNDTA